MSPRGSLQNAKPTITVQFNLPVTAHHAEEFFFVTPYVEGRLVQGSSTNEVKFIPDQDFPRGSRVTITLESGLTSDSGKKLLSDYVSDFFVDYPRSGILFKQNEWSGKFMSFQVSRGTDITMQIGNGVSNPSVKVYKVTPELLLQSFTYANSEYDSNSDRSWYPGIGQYYEKAVDTSGLPLVAEYNDLADGYRIEFKDEVGVYLFQALNGKEVANSVWIALNENGIHFRQDVKKSYLLHKILPLAAPPTTLISHFINWTDNRVFWHNTLSRACKNILFLQTNA